MAVIRYYENEEQGKCKTPDSIFSNGAQKMEIQTLVSGPGIISSPSFVI